MPTDAVADQKEKESKNRLVNELGYIVENATTTEKKPLILLRDEAGNYLGNENRKLEK